MLKKFKNKNLLAVLLLLLFFSFHRFYNLGFKEIQMWDESLYGVRAKSIYYFNDWLDQTEHAVGELYSSSHPPLLIWLMALLYKLFGVSEFTTRFFSALFGLLTVILTYLLTKNFFDNKIEPSQIKASVFSIPFLGSVYLFNFYSRQAQLDIPYIFFITLSIYFYLEFLTGKRYSLYLCGFSFGLALMTKIIVGFFALIAIGIFLVLMYLRKESSIKEVVTQLMIVSSVGFLIALPWHIYMLKVHGLGFINTFFKFHIFERLYQGVEGNIPELGYLYILNQLVAQFPPVVLVFFDLIDTLKTLRHADKSRVLIHVWFWSTFLIVSLSKTKIPTYSLPSFIPAAIIASIYLVKIIREDKNLLPLSTLLIAIVWSSSQELRDGFKSLVKFNLTKESFALTAVFLIAVLLSPFLIRTINKLTNKENLAKVVFYLSVLIGVWLIFKTEILTDYSRYNDGARAVCNFIDSSKVDTLFYLYTKHSTEGMNPQLTFYSYRKLSGSISWIEIPRHDYKTIWTHFSSSRNPIVLVERSGKDKFEKFAEVDSLMKILVKFNFRKVIEVKRYFLFQSEKF